MSSAKVLVTGAGGFIGSHLVEELVQSGKSVKAFVSYRSDGGIGWLSDIDPKVLKDVEIFRGDVRDPNGVRTALTGCGGVMHLAALIGIPYSYHSPDSYVDVNIKGTLNVLQAARDLRVEKIVSTSTSEVYGTAQVVPITELHPLVGQSPYSATKIGSDQIALSFFKSFESPVVIVRPFNTYGPRQSERAVISTILDQIARGETQVKLGSTTPTRDFVYVKDTVKGFSAAFAKGKLGEVYNLSTGYEISISDLVLLAGQASGKTLQVKSEDERQRPEKSEVERLCGDSSKAKRDLNWQPARNSKQGLLEGLKDFLSWRSSRTGSLKKETAYQI